MPEFLVWEEPRLTASGFVTTFVLSVGSKSRWVCRRQDEAELRRLKELCEKSGLETIPTSKELVKGARAEKKDTSAQADGSKQDSAKAEQQDTTHQLPTIKYSGNWLDSSSLQGARTGKGLKLRIGLAMEMAPKCEWLRA